MIDRQVSGIARLAQDLMDATRVDQGALRLNKFEFEIAPLLADSCEITAAAAAAKNQAFTVSIPDRTLRVEGDPERLTQAIGNLLHNAVKYTPVHGNIRMTVLAEGSNVVIRIKDDGAGISPVLLPHIFELFAQCSRTIASSAGGLGIGLAVVTRLLKLTGVRCRQQVPARGRAVSSRSSCRSPRNHVRLCFFMAAYQWSGGCLLAGEPRRTGRRRDNLEVRAIRIPSVRRHAVSCEGADLCPDVDATYNPPYIGQTSGRVKDAGPCRASAQPLRRWSIPPSIHIYRQEIVGESGAVPGELRSVRNGPRSSRKRKSSARGAA
ncbi:sensor histidine kinase [Paraburkholderia aromaticivorans]|uniref:histidine kinase n=1 Tax=Paraburkholderia aromaticivorans TaxID=2026199 RepID=A0A248VDA2_9BURK|nr:hypothetical protein CJU94_02015 [Paraburkholderia aromaticivorans]